MLKKTNVYGQSWMLNKWTTISHAGTRDAHALDYVVLLSFQVFIFRQYVTATGTNFAVFGCPVIVRIQRLEKSRVDGKTFC